MHQKERLSVPCVGIMTSSKGQGIRTNVFLASWW